MRRASRFRGLASVFLFAFLVGVAQTLWHPFEGASCRRKAGAAPAPEAPADTPAGAAGQESDNSACYVCHPSLKSEKITTVHLKKGYGCVKCHGSSMDHAQDEMQMTTPDILYGRRQVDPMCGECHEDPHHDVQPEVAAFLKRWRGQPRENGRAVTEKSICTDCHGTHNISLETGSNLGAPSPGWQAAFNGTDLAGWKPSGLADWKVENGRIAGTPSETGDGTLWHDTEYENCRAAITFRADLPLHAGVYVRGKDGDPGPRVEILIRKDPPTYTGSVVLPSGRLVLLNRQENTFDEGGWNTLAVEVRGRRVAVWLNGEEIGAVCCVSAPRGRLGLFLQGGPDYRGGQLAVREIQVQELPTSEEDDGVR